MNIDFERTRKVVEHECDDGRSALKKFRKYPNVEIQTVLRLSYDGLDIPEKRLFLDIVFFFKGERIEKITRVLDAFDDFYVDCGIDTLLDKALITISRDNRVEVHDLLQEMAEEVVREEYREYPKKRSRLNDAMEIQDVLNNSMGTDAIEGFTLNTHVFDDDLYLSAEAFKKMSNLRFFKIRCHSRGYNTIHLPNGLDSLPNKMWYFCWEGYPLKSLPLGFCPKKRVELHMRFSKVEKLWDGVQDLMNLNKIDLSFSKALKELPDFSKAQNLEMVSLQFCENLCSIHPSMFSLPKLGILYLKQCRKLKNLHGKHNHLESLKHLELTNCTAPKQLCYH